MRFDVEISLVHHFDLFIVVLLCFLVFWDKERSNDDVSSLAIEDKERYLQNKVNFYSCAVLIFLYCWAYFVMKRQSCARSAHDLDSRFDLRLLSVTFEILG